jgi:hypothetical protein
VAFPEDLTGFGRQNTIVPSVDPALTGDRPEKIAYHTRRTRGLSRAEPASGVFYWASSIADHLGLASASDPAQKNPQSIHKARPPLLLKTLWVKRKK